MTMNRALFLSVLVLYFADVPVAGHAQEVTVGSKVFTESVILGEMISQLASDAGAVVDHKQDLGGTQVLWQALLRGDIDVYPEYTGTISQEILGGSVATESDMRSSLEAQGIRMSRSLGFNNTYVIGMKRSLADSLEIRTISDLRQHPGLTFGFSIEFMDREDGWPGLRSRFALKQQNVFGLEHTLAYQGLESGSIHATDLYSTDAEISYYNLTVLEDDLSYFPEYRAVLLYRSQLEESAPAVVASILRLQDMIGEIEMVALNARAKIDGVTEPRIASEFLAMTLGVTTEVTEDTVLQALIRNTFDHLWLVSVSLSAAILLAIPLGIFAARRPALGQTILSVVGVIQTIPSLALLVFMIPVLGIGGPPAMMALFLYSLLPIVRNTYSGLTDISKPLLESAEALGLPAMARLRLVELPTASRTILAGIKTSAVINVGTATLGAIIGAGGYGQPILTGIRLDDLSLILQGAIPAAVLALLVQGGFELAERVVVPKGLRLASE